MSLPDAQDGPAPTDPPRDLRFAAIGDAYTAALAPAHGLRGWHALSIRSGWLARDGRCAVRLHASHGVVRAYDLHPASVPGRGWSAMLLLDPTIRAVELAPWHGLADGKATPSGRLRRIGRLGAAWRLALREPGGLLRAMLRSPGGPSARLRQGLAEAATNHRWPRDYAAWVRLCDRLDPATRAALHDLDPATLPTLRVLVFGTDGPAAAATMASLPDGLPAAIVPDAATLEAVLATATETYVVALQAGELAAADAIPILRLWLLRVGQPEAAYADEDALDAAGVRRAPLFKPEISRTLLRSGLLTRGMWAFRRDRVTAGEGAEAGWAETWRLGQALRLDPAARTPRLPVILTHRRPNVADAPAAALAAVVAADAARFGRPVRIDATRMPLRVRPVAVSTPAVAIIIPTAARHPQTLRCMQAVLGGTRWPRVELIPVLMQPAQPDAAQSATLDLLGRDPRVRRLVIEGEAFNYSTANNRAAALTTAPVLAFLNDDVAPLDPEWLGTMVAHLADARVGVVGAKLLYPNGRVQHGGVLLGQAALTGHAFQDLPGEAAGPAGRAVLDQAFSAVTGACMLVRAALHAELGGQDEAYASAFGDVDFCLRAREAGHDVVWSAHARLTHHETLTYGHHYGGPHSAREAADMARLRRRWPALTREDPFYSPSLSQRAHQQWTLAFPPRHGREALVQELLAARG